MEIICLDTNILIAHKRAKKADKDKTLLFRFASQGYRFAVSSITVCGWQPAMSGILRELKV